jgi:hypothetical protein
MGHTTIGVRRERPFKPSWIDRFNDWIEDRSIPAWLAFVVFGFVLVAVQILVLWLEGGLQARDLLPVIVYNGLFTPYLLALICLLDHQALSALRSMRSALDMTQSKFKTYEYRLSTMPFPLPLVVGLIMLTVVVLMEWFSTTPVRYGALGQFHVFRAVFQIVDKSSAFLFGVFIAHTIRQLQLVSRINANYVRINLFDRRSLQVFSTLTASTAVGLLFGVYGWILINPDLLMDPVIFGFIAIMTVLAMTVFALPLYGMHRRMAMAKERAIREIDRRSQTIFSTFNERVDADDYAAVEILSGVIDSLEVQYNRISGIPTWPWRPEAVRFLLAAIALPLVLEIILFLVGQAWGW